MVLERLDQYTRPKGYWHSTWALLHWPRAMFCYAFLIWGAVLSPEFHLDRLILSFVAFFGCLQVTSYSFDELVGRHVGTSISDAELKFRGAVGIWIALSVGIYLTLTVTWLILPIWVFGLFIVIAYNLEIWHGPFHNHWMFGLTWGSLVVIGSAVLHGGITPAALAAAVAAFALAREEIMSYGLTGCKQANFCRDYAKEQGTTVCHGSWCWERLHMPRDLTRLTVRVLKARWVAMLAITAALVLWRFLG